MKNKSYVYVVRIPHDDFERLEHHEVYTSRREAFQEAQTRVDSLLGWQFKYISWKLRQPDSNTYIKHEGKDTIVVEQLPHYYPEHLYPSL